MYIPQNLFLYSPATSSHNIQATRAKMHIDRLNDDCLRKVFAHLSLDDVLSLEFVCHRWKTLQQERLHRQTTLKLFADRLQLTSFIHNETILYKQMQCCGHYGSSQDYLLVSSLNLAYSRLLVDKFPNLRMLLIVGCTIGVKCLTFVLSQWTRLECLSLIHLPQPLDWSAVYPYIDSFENLRHLSLFEIGTHSSLHLPRVLAQIEQFQFGHFRVLQQSLRDVLLQLESNRSLHTLGFYDTDCTIADLTQFVNMNNTIQHQVTRLAFMYNVLHHTTVQNRVERDLFSFISDNFLSLTCLDIYSVNEFKAEELPKLRQLVQLREFSLYAGEGANLYSIKPLEDYAFCDQIPSIRRLHLSIDIVPPTLEVVVLLFPNVESLSINFGRICCSCPDVVTEVIEIPPLPPIPIPVVPDQANQAELPPIDPNVPVGPADPQPNQPTDPEQPLPPPPPPPEPEEPTIIEEDNCEPCSEKAMFILSSLHSLNQLSITGDRCKDAAIKAMDDAFRPVPLAIIDFASCVNYSLKQLLNVCYALATQRERQNRAVWLRINSDKAGKIVRLQRKPANLHITNIDPIVSDDEL